MKTEGVCSPVLSGGTEPQPVTAEELGKALFAATENMDSEFGRWAATFDELKDVGKQMWINAAAAILEKYEVRRK